jgi:hypothetical protein
MVRFPLSAWSSEWCHAGVSGGRDLLRRDGGRVKREFEKGGESREGETRGWEGGKVSSRG